ncbi:hypothetical protein NUM3379_28240 [Kineococcus sp. NUM-3379]
MREVPGVPQGAGQTPWVLLTPALEVVRCSRAWAGLHLPLGDVRNLAHAVFCAPRAGSFYVDPVRVEQALVARLRSGLHDGPREEDADGDDPAVAGVVADLLARSAAFRRLWAGRELRFRGRDGYEVNHPDLGRLVFEHRVCRAPGGLWRDEYLPRPGTRTAELAGLLALL